MYNSGKSNSHKTRHWVGALLIHLSYEVAASLSLNMAMGLRVGDLLSALLRLPSDICTRSYESGCKRNALLSQEETREETIEFWRETFKALPTSHMIYSDKWSEILG